MILYQAKKKYILIYQINQEFLIFFYHCTFFVFEKLSKFNPVDNGGSDRGVYFSLLWTIVNVFQEKQTVHSDDSFNTEQVKQVHCILGVNKTGQKCMGSLIYIIYYKLFIFDMAVLDSALTALDGLTRGLEMILFFRKGNFGAISMGFVISLLFI